MLAIPIYSSGAEGIRTPALRRAKSELHMPLVIVKCQKYACVSLILVKMVRASVTRCRRLPLLLLPRCCHSVSSMMGPGLPTFTGTYLRCTRL